MLAGVDYEAALEYIQEAINKQESVVKVFRLLCLYSLTNNGLKEKEYNFIRREILQTYGYRYMFALERFAKLGELELLLSDHSRQLAFSFDQPRCCWHVLPEPPSVPCSYTPSSQTPTAVLGSQIDFFD